MSYNGDPSNYRRAPSERAQLTRPTSSPAGTGSYGYLVFRRIAVGLAICLVAVSVAGYLTFRSVWDSITRVPLYGLGAAPPKLTSAMNVLVIGSDTRSGSNKRFGAGITGQRSDTIIILHIAPHHRGVIALSIPRDSVVPVLSCPPEAGAEGQLAQPGQVEQINATFAAGGPGCLWKTVEYTTHLHLDHFIELNFTGFENVINDVGGVSICLPFAINDRLSKLHLSSGRHHVGGAEALAFWRARYLGEGSDLQRIRRDQYLMAALLQGVEHTGLTSSPSRFVSVITDAARSMTTDSGLSLPTMIGIADSLRALPPGGVQFIELPTEAYGPNPNWVIWPPSDPALFKAIALDRAIYPAASVSKKPVPSGRDRDASATDQASLARSYGGITGRTNVCHDRAAFAGPLSGS
jgi:LCP family protein required for cell wall assembly